MKKPTIAVCKYGHSQLRQEIPNNVIEPLDVSERLDQLEESGDLSECPDCYWELSRDYEWDTVKYRCENCGILINNLAFLKEES